MAGYLIGFTKGAQVIGCIFIFSHGLLGFWLMSNSIVENILDKQIYFENVGMQQYMNLCVILTIIATFILMLFNIFKKVRDNNIFRIIPICIYNVVLILIVIFKMVYLGA